MCLRSYRIYYSAWDLVACRREREGGGYGGGRKDFRYGPALVDPVIVDPLRWARCATDTQIQDGDSGIRMVIWTRYKDEFFNFHIEEVEEERNSPYADRSFEKRECMKR